MGIGVKIKGDRLKKLLEEKNLSHRQFSEMIFGSQNNANRISKYIKGQIGMNPDTLKAMADCLNVSTEYLTGEDTQKETDKYKSNKKFVSEILKGWYGLAENQNVNLDFISALRQLVDFDRYFPVDGILRYEYVLKNGFPIDEYRYVKKPLPESAKLNPSDPNSVLQITRNGETHNMCVFDILFLKDLQEYLTQCTLDYMKQRQEEIQQEWMSANDIFNKKIEENTTTHNGGVTFTAFNPNMFLSATELNEIVRYKIYQDKPKKENE